MEKEMIKPANENMNCFVPCDKRKIEAGQCGCNNRVNELSKFVSFDTKCGGVKIVTNIPVPPHSFTREELKELLNKVYFQGFSDALADNYGNGVKFINSLFEKL